MTARTTHALILSGGCHALVAILLVLVGLSSPRLVETSASPFRLITWSGAGQESLEATPATATADFKIQIPVRPHSTTPPAAPTASEPDVPRLVPKPSAVKPPRTAPPAPAVTRPTASPRTPPPRSAPAFPAINTDEILAGLQPNPSAGPRENNLAPSDTHEGSEELKAYFALLKQRVRAALVPPPDAADGWVATVTFRISADGVLSGVRISKSSGSAAFNAAVVAAFAHVRMPEKPDRRAEELQLSFRMKEIVGG